MMGDYKAMETEESKLGLLGGLLNPAEMAEEIPKELKAAQKFLEEGDYMRAKTIANSIAHMNRQLNLPGIDEKLKVLFENTRIKRTEARKTKPSLVKCKRGQ